MGLRQRETLSCILFNIALEKVVRDTVKETIYNKTFQILAYADDIVLVVRTTDVLKEAIINLSKTAKEIGLNNQSAKNLNTWK
jgi:sorting nexin-29